MKLKQLLTTIPLFLSACTTIHYQDNESTFDAVSYFTFQQADKLVVTIDANKRTMELQGATSDQVQALERVAGAIAAAAIKP